MKQKKNLISVLLLLFFSSWASAQNIPVKLNVDAGRQIATVTKLFNGSNIEDLNNQTNGGIFYGAQNETYIED